jgi:phosphate transport system protein
MISQVEEEINALREMLLTMASHVEAAVSQAVRAFVERDDELARLVIGKDAIVDRLEVEIDERVITLLTKALLATDLRLMTVAIKFAHDLERAADEATTIARRTIMLNKEPESGLATEIPRMARMALALLKESLDTFTNRQPEQARKIIPRDKEVDELNKMLHQDLTGRMIERPGSISVCLNLMVISKSLERIGDLAKNMAEEVVYLYEAQDIRHTNKGIGDV